MALLQPEGKPFPKCERNNSHSNTLSYIVVDLVAGVKAREDVTVLDEAFNTPFILFIPINTGATGIGSGTGSFLL